MPRPKVNKPTQADLYDLKNAVILRQREINPIPPLTDLIIEFIEWTHTEECPYHMGDVQGDITWFNKKYPDPITTQELYDFWIKEVKGI